MNYRKAYREITEDHFPEKMTITLGDTQLEYQKKTWRIETPTGLEEKGLRYGENPGQEAALYELVNGNLVLGECQFIGAGNGLVSSVSSEDLIQSGKHPGKTNLTDVDSALNILKYFDEPTVVIVKHNNPSGVATRSTLVEAYREAYYADRIAAFGGAAVCNRTIDKETAREMSHQYLEVVCAPHFEEDALEYLKQRKNLRIIQIRNIEKLQQYAYQRFLDFRSLMDGGLVIQQSPLNTIRSVEDFKTAVVEHKGVEYANKRAPTEKELNDMLFGWRVEMGVTSNSVIYVKNNTTVGIGTGEQDRVGVAEIAALKAYQKYADRLCFEEQGKPLWVLKEDIQQGKAEQHVLDDINTRVATARGNLEGSIMISDAFFPFPDTVAVAKKFGITGIVQPGGSLNDHLSIEAANDAGIAMVFTGQRAFKH